MFGITRGMLEMVAQSSPVIASKSHDNISPCSIAIFARGLAR
jgi:hypothetical protein